MNEIKGKLRLPFFVKLNYSIWLGAASRCEAIYIPVTLQDAGFSVQLGNLNKAQLEGNG